MPVVPAQMIEQFPTAGSLLPDALNLFPDVSVRKLVPHADDRGVFTELFRSEWALGPEPVQWNIVESHANVLRGVHVHRNHLDYLTVVSGEMLVLLHDFRSASSAKQPSLMFRLQADDPHMVVIPVGVAHGFYFAAPCRHAYSVTKSFDGSDEFGCRWDAPELQAPWPCSNPVLSIRDQAAGSYAAMVAGFMA